ncbi:MAG: GerMN domain-containing protein [Pseudonocardia sp.]
MRRLSALLAGVVVGLAGCGVPTSGDPTTIAASDIPYGLASPTPSTPTSPSPQTMLVQTGIYLVTPEETLVLRGREVGSGTRRDQLDALLDFLAEGPTGTERDDELSTALPPEVRLDVEDLSASTVTIAISGPTDVPSGGQSRRAVAQIVLTATSVAGVDAVLLTLHGEPLEAPLPDGALTTAPLTARDFEPFLTAPVPSPTTTSPPS